MRPKTTKRAPLSGTRLDLDAELLALDAEVIGIGAHLPKAIGRELGAVLLRLQAHGHTTAAAVMAKRYGTTVPEVEHWGQEFAAELVAARQQRRPDSEKTIQLLIDELSEPR